MDWLNLLVIAGKSTCVYLFILLALRIFGKKELAQLSVIDLVFILLISNSVQNAMVGPDTSLLGGLAAATGLFIINYLFRWLFRAFPRFSRTVQGEEIILIWHGKVVENHLQKAMMTRAELDAAVREHGVESVEHVNLAVMEVDGNISVLSNDFTKRTKRRAQKMLSKQ